MRRTVLSVLALALALLPVAGNAEMKIGVVDMQRALNEVEEGKSALALLKKDFDERQKQIQARKAEFDKMAADFDRQSVVMSEAARKEKTQDLERRAVELQNLALQGQKELAEREREHTRGIFDKMSAIVREIAEADGFTMVLDRSGGIVFAQASLDLTNELIRKYNARFPGGGAKTGGAKAGGAKKDASPKK